MSKKAAVPDAWDDDWESLADVRILRWMLLVNIDWLTISQKPAAPSPAEAAPKLTKTQRRVQHQAQQKQLWDSAEDPDRMQWLEAKGVVPLKQEFKPQVTLLSRNPTPSIAKRNATDGMGKLSLDDEDSDEEARKKQAADLEERQRKARIEREEKQRRYAEARERIMGSPKPAAGTAPAGSRESSHGRDGRRSRGKNNSNRNSQPTSSTDQSPSRAGAQNEKQLFDPDDMGRRLPKRDSPAPSRELHPTRQPRGPEGGGRGGFGFAQRGGRASP